MLDLIHLLYSTEEFSIPIGGHMSPCQKCGQLQPHLIYQVVKRDTGIVIVKKETPLHKVSQCEVCHEMFRHRNNSEPLIIEPWGPDSDPHDYAIRSGYDPIDPNYSLITPRSAQALLESVTAKSAVAMDLTWKDYSIACSMFILCGIVAAILFSQQKMDDNARFMLLGIPSAGLILALFFLVYLQNLRKVKIDHLGDFHDRLNRLGVSPGSIVSALPQTVFTNQKIYTLARPFM